MKAYLIAPILLAVAACAEEASIEHRASNSLVTGISNIVYVMDHGELIR